MTKVKRNKLALWTASLCAFGMVVGLAACAPQNNANDATDQKAEEKPAVQVETPEADSFGVVVADSWKDIYPDQYKSYMENEANKPLQNGGDKHNYLELYPALNTMYKGYAFALGYDEAAGHLYTLQSVKETPRTTKKEQLAGCITCKTPQFTKMVEDEGEGVYKEKFNDLIGEFDEPISCYNCHENDPQTLNVTGSYFVDSLGKDYGEKGKAPMNAQVCGQCHNEYYFDGETKATSNPYTGLDAMTPETMLAFYDEKGFKDWNHADTFAPMLKVQHPEFETMYGGEQSPMAKQGYGCADCHMAPAEGESGEYTSHNWVSPLENAELMKNDCSKCHADLEKEVKDIQANEEKRVTAISEKIEDMTGKIAAKYADEIAAMKAANEAKTEIPAASEDLAKLQKLQRTAQWYWDFVMVENSEGAHNSKLTEETLDKAEAAVDEALAMLA
ncbi:ammonia-forming cytochrome c nitrite reductase subunit c552 [Arabiibacter massiliensis]|uniref:ammonia-forming cytochrome c nitrite reductase subunit c552 n=1 Tax=Arabiibacter massiliensis TaxID=1870985 RepID=UPI0009B97C65|nr:ammonia-forming cytochrome c nitrite reductase subunit c552 [Arabiibacter massiliensis]